ncbi:MAG: hypothetical protein WA800_13085 [Terriglobales bacterium]
MSFEGKKPMASALVRPNSVIAEEIAEGLSALSIVGSVHLLQTDRALAVWVGLPEAASETERYRVYEFEDDISGRYPSVLFDFHIVSIPEGRRTEEFLSMAAPIFQRNIA